MLQKSESVIMWKWACAAVYLVAALNMVLGWIATSNGTGHIGDFQFNGGLLFGVGLFYAVLGVLTNNRIVAALWIAAVLFTLDALVMIYTSGTSGHFTMLGFSIRVGLLFAMYRGIPALNLMKQDAATVLPASPAPINDSKPSVPPMTGYQAPRTPAGPEVLSVTMDLPPSSAAMADVPPMSAYQPMRGSVTPEIPSAAAFLPMNAPRMLEAPAMTGYTVERGPDPSAIARDTRRLGSNRQPL